MKQLYNIETLEKVRKKVIIIFDDFPKTLSDAKYRLIHEKGLKYQLLSKYNLVTHLKAY